MAKKKQTDNEIIDEVIAKSASAVKNLPEEVIDEIVAAPVIKTSAAKAPGMYHNGRLIEKVVSRLGRTWVVAIDGKREKVLRTEIEIVG